MLQETYYVVVMQRGGGFVNWEMTSLTIMMFLAVENPYPFTHVHRSHIGSFTFSALYPATLFYRLDSVHHTHFISPWCLATPTLTWYIRTSKEWTTSKEFLQINMRNTGMLKCWLLSAYLHSFRFKNYCHRCPLGFFQSYIILIFD